MNITLIVIKLVLSIITNFKDNYHNHNIFVDFTDEMTCNSSQDRSTS